MSDSEECLSGEKNRVYHFSVADKTVCSDKNEDHMDKMIHRILPRLTGSENLGFIRQYLTALCACLSGVVAGAACNWVTPLIPRFLSPESAVPMSPEQLSWILSVIELGDAITPVPVALLADWIGRKPILLAAGPLYILGWLIIIYTRSVEALILTRMIQGLTVGMQYSVLPVYLGEIAGPKIRGSIGMFVQNSFYIGIMFEYAIGPFLQYDNVMWASLSLTVMFLMAFFWFPESPYYLTMRKKEEEAIKILAWLRATKDENGEALREEMAIIQKEVEAEGGLRSGWKELVTTREGRLGLGLGVAVMGTSLMGGVVTTLSYASVIFSAGSQAHWCMAAGILLLVCFPVAGILVDRLGRRPVFILASGVAALASFLVGLSFYFRPEFIPDWTNDVLVVIYLVFLAAGVESLFPLLQSELFPTSTRSIGSAVMVVTSCVLSFASIKSYNWFLTQFGMYSNFFVFSSFCTFGFFIIFFYLPETKGKTFEEIQNSLK